MSDEVIVQGYPSCHTVTHTIHVTLLHFLKVTTHDFDPCILEAVSSQKYIPNSETSDSQYSPDSPDSPDSPESPE